jgi:hypothetical protein
VISRASLVAPDSAPEPRLNVPLVPTPERNTLLAPLVEVMLSKLPESVPVVRLSA